MMSNLEEKFHLALMKILLEHANVDVKLTKYEQDLADDIHQLWLKYLDLHKWDYATKSYIYYKEIADD